MARETKAERLEKQKKRQAEYRAAQTEMRRPSRDDIARVALHWLLVSLDKEAKQSGSTSSKHKIEGIIIERLAGQGFDEHAAETALDDLTRKYVKEGWEFQLKPHLKRLVDGDQN